MKILVFVGCVFSIIFLGMYSSKTSENQIFQYEKFEMLVIIDSLKIENKTYQKIFHYYNELQIQQDSIIKQQNVLIKNLQKELEACY